MTSNYIESVRVFLEEFMHCLSGVILTYCVVYSEINQVYVDLPYMNPMG